jgi:hypothetical protein
LWATYDLVTFAAFLRRIGFSRPSYVLLAVLSLSYVFLFYRAWKGKLTDSVKWIGVTISIGGIFLMMQSPANSLTIQIVSRILYMLFASTGCLMFVETQKDSKLFPKLGKYVLVSGYLFLFIVLRAALSLPTEDSEVIKAPAAERSPSRRAPVDYSSRDSLATRTSVKVENELNFRWVLPPKYYYGNHFHEGRVWVREKQDGPWTLFDSEGNVIKKDFMARIVYPSKNRNTVFMDIEKDRKTGWFMYGILDFSGEIISSPKPYRSYPDYLEGLSSQRGENGLYGFIDCQGSWIVPPIYKGSRSRREGLAAVEIDGKWGFIDKEGEVVIDFQFEDAYLFSNGLAAVKQNSLFGLIDRNGNWITEPIYERFYYPFSHLIAAQKDGKIGYLDTKGHVVIDFKYGGTEGIGINIGHTGAFFEGRAIVPLSRTGEGRDAVYTWGVINEYGDIIPTNQDGFMTVFSNGFAVARRNNRLFMLDRDGKEYSLPREFHMDGAALSPLDAGTFVYKSDEGIFMVRFKNKGGNPKIGYFKVGN